MFAIYVLYAFSVQNSLLINSYKLRAVLFCLKFVPCDLGDVLHLDHSVIEASPKQILHPIKQCFFVTFITFVLNVINENIYIYKLYNKFLKN